jgi:hypothetical protein
MLANRLNPLKGWPHDAALDFRAQISPNVLYPMVAGQVGHLDNQFMVEPGVVGTQMPLFLFSGSQDFSVSAPPNSQWIPVFPSGFLTLLVGKGAFELETTEFDATQTYYPNTLLRAPIGNAANAYPGSGQLTSANLVLGTNAYCGVVSRGVYTVNSFGQKVLAFWPVYGPVAGNS